MASSLDFNDEFRCNGDCGKLVCPNRGASVILDEKWYIGVDASLPSLDPGLCETFAGDLSFTILSCVSLCPLSLLSTSKFRDDGDSYENSELESPISLSRLSFVIGDINDVWKIRSSADSLGLLLSFGDANLPLLE